MSEIGKNPEPYKPNVLFVGNRQTVQTQIRRHVTSVCLQNIQLKFEKNRKIQPYNPYNRNGLVQLIMVGNSNRPKWVKDF